MVYTALSKPSPQSKYISLKVPDPDSFLANFKGSIVKDIGISLHKIIKQKYGRKIRQKQSKQSHHKANNPCPITSVNKSEADQKKIENGRPSPTTQQQNRPKSIKRHTYNYQCLSSQRSEEAENDILNIRGNRSKAKKSYIATQKTWTHDKIKRIYPENRLFQDKQEKNKEDLDYDEDQCEFLQPKISNHLRKLSIHGKLAPIDLNQNAFQKASLVDLIKKFKFENLKTNHLNSSSSKNSIEQKKKYGDNNLTKTQSKKGNLFFKEQQGSDSTYCNPFHHRKVNKKSSKQFRKHIRECSDKNTNIRTIKMTKSILSPWGTITDHYFFNQTPIE